jgi:hypothetical protein
MLRAETRPTCNCFVIASAVTVEYSAFREIEIAGGHLDRAGDQRRPVMIGQGPAGALAARAVNHRGQVRPATFEYNAPRIRYHWFRSQGLFVGSGAVEPGCKAVIGQRLKLSGMRWTVAVAHAITTLRCQQASRPEDRIWSARRRKIPAA